MIVGVILLLISIKSLLPSTFRMMAQLIGGYYLFFGGIVFIYNLRPEVVDNIVVPINNGIRDSIRQEVFKEYQSLLEGIHRRGSQIHAVFSILIVGSILAVIPLINSSTNLESNTSYLIILPVVSIGLIIATILFYVTSWVLDDVSWSRINHLEHQLGIGGHKWLHDSIRNDKLTWIRGLIWPALLSMLLSIYIFLAINIF
jgi:hypothetical protein